MSTRTAAHSSRASLRSADRSQEFNNDSHSAMFFLAPFVILYVLFIIGPAIYGLVMSFFDTSLVKSGLGDFAGLANYAEAISSRDFWSSLWHTIWFTILTTPPLVIVSFFFALLAERARRARWFFRLAFFLPYVLPSAVVALIWIWLYTPVLGLFTRWAALPIAFSMVVAALTVHLKAGFFLPNGAEYVLALFVASVTLALTGSGSFSVDRWLEKRAAGKSAEAPHRAYPQPAQVR